ncbi:MAG: hypothetical protein GSR86_04640 [Desulfurococcales archaeon]|nr:hypothetical protein [Desulfurococcales archaeon]
MGSCCIDPGKLDHSREEIYEALGISGEAKEKISRVIEEALSRAKISEMIQHIWHDSCEDLTLEERIYATFRLGMDVYSLLLEAIIEKSGEGDNGA